MNQRHILWGSDSDPVVFSVGVSLMSLSSQKSLQSINNGILPPSWLISCALGKCKVKIYLNFTWIRKVNFKIEFYEFVHGVFLLLLKPINICNYSGNQICKVDFSFSKLGSLQFFKLTH
jgi:hypothetical protein